ncbi:cupin domain-containing protein [Longimicrobium sp.]|jgi:quercetin dioxygenase-like cupin family protein|uniref:cupin domain-containing protein n=1 Tax=Longimicrobium sp. TaxID=2029185 RepID=UPI002EDAAFF2
MMDVRSYLNGALTVQRLGGDDGESLFHAGDARGAVAWLARGTPFSFLHVVEFAAVGVRRGFHAHTGHTEHFYLFSGALTLIAAAEGGRVQVELAAGDLAVFAPGTAHGLIAREPSVAVAMGNGSDPTRDVSPVDLGNPD